jgi:menaquinone-dependent protoporphyrinogen IX oxidase
MARKKKTELVESADVAEMKKIKNTKWPKVVVGSHLTVTTYENGKTELVWDDAALLKDVQKALTDAESSVKVNTVKTTRRKKKNEA